MHFFPLTYSNNYPLHISNILTIHNQEVALLYFQLMVFIILKIYYNCTSCWSLLRNYIMMHGPQNVIYIYISMLKKQNKYNINIRT